MSPYKQKEPIQFNFELNTTAGLFVCAGGFEARANAFLRRVRKNRIHVEEGLILHYDSQRVSNEDKFNYLWMRLEQLDFKRRGTIHVHAERPIDSCRRISVEIGTVAARLKNRKAIVDISGMTHLLALATVHTCIGCGLETTIIYTESKAYYPPKDKRRMVVKAWRERDYESASEYLQSSGLGSVQILPEFSGNFRPGKQTCLIVFVGHEPNRVEGLVDSYAPSAVIVFYGLSPHRTFDWRTKLSRELHAELFAQWHTREVDVSTLYLEEILEQLEREYFNIRDQYDVAIAGQCSKMQAIAAYLFWRKHPEVQLVFTSPVRFNPQHYSWGAGRTYGYRLPSY